MREAFGGSWLVGFVALFIVLFSAYLAVSINYTKAFKAKNKIISLIEENEGFSTSTGNVANKTDRDLQNSSRTEDKVYYYLRNAGFALDTTSLKGRCPNGDDPYTGGYCVQKMYTSQGAYYKVTTFVMLEIPVIWVNITVPVKGETKVLYYTRD